MWWCPRPPVRLVKFVFTAVGRWRPRYVATGHPTPPKPFPLYPTRFRVPGWVFKPFPTEPHSSRPPLVQVGRGGGPFLDGGGKESPEKGPVKGSMFFAHTREGSRGVESERVCRSSVSMGCTNNRFPGESLHKCLMGSTSGECGLGPCKWSPYLGVRDRWVTSRGPRAWGFKRVERNVCGS